MYAQVFRDYGQLVSKIFLQDFSTLTPTTGGLDGVDPEELEKYLEHFDDYDSALRQIKMRVPKEYFTNSSSLTIGQRAESTAVIASTLGLYYVLEH